MPGLPKLVVVVRVTTRCPLRCVFCGYSRDLRYSRTDIDATKLLQFGEVLASYQVSSQRPVLVSWLGGEPYCWAELLRVSRQFRQWNLMLGVTTNGAMLASPRWRQRTIELFRQVTVSVDGLPSQHEAVRQSPGLFHRLRENVRRLRAAADSKRLLLRCNTVLMRSNIDQFERFCEEMVEWGFDELTFNPLGGHDRPAFFRDHRLLPGQVDRLAGELPGIRQRMLQRGLVIGGTDQYLRRLLRSARDLPIAIDDCRPAETFLFVSEDATISPCSFTINDYAVPLEEIATTEAFRGLSSRFRQCRRGHRAAACGDCHASHVIEKFPAEPALSSIQTLQTNGHP